MLEVRNKLIGVWSEHLEKNGAFVDEKSHWAKQRSLSRKKMKTMIWMMLTSPLLILLRAGIFYLHWIVVFVVLDKDVVCFSAERGQNLVVFGSGVVQGHYSVLEVLTLRGPGGQD